MVPGDHCLPIAAEPSYRTLEILIWASTSDSFIYLVQKRTNKVIDRIFFMKEFGKRAYWSRGDSHDMVLRFNNAPTINYTEDVGSKTTFRVLNSQVVTKPEFKFLDEPLYKDISIVIWDPANYSSTLEEWYRYPDFPLFPVYKRLLEDRPHADVHLLQPHVLWDLWAVLQNVSPYRLRRNPPSSGFIGVWFAMHRCKRVRVFEYVPSVRATRRCHYHVSRDDAACTLGAWHPLAQEKALAERIRDNADLDVFQRGFIDIPGLHSVNC